MKIKIEPYNPLWENQFEQLKKELSILLEAYYPVIEHFGSTSVEGLAAKPVIDILVGIQEERLLDEIVEKILPHKKYIYYQVFNERMPNRRLFVRLKDEANERQFPQIFGKDATIPHEAINHLRYAHVHVWEFGVPDWTRHIAFRDYLRTYPNVKERYAQLKQALSLKNWKDGMEYNAGKNEFIKEIEAKAILWYQERKI